MQNTFVTVVSSIGAVAFGLLACGGGDDGGGGSLSAGVTIGAGTSSSETASSSSSASASSASASSSSSSGTSSSSSSSSTTSSSSSSAESSSSSGLPPDCNNDIQDGDETAADCGGSCPDDCADGLGCVVDADCVSGVCAANDTCAAPTCNDDVKNGDEVGVDCSGSCPQKCETGQTCVVNEDCIDKKCDPVLFTCLPPACDDIILNGDESDIDCGGSCPACRPGQHCDGASDCIGNTCTAQACACPPGMVTVTVNAGGSYCVDSGEVTWADYVLFQAANVPLTAPFMPAECTAADTNESWLPPSGWPPNTTTPAAPNYVQKPIRNVDWCDAAGYCLWKGKRLCGDIAGGATAEDDLDDAGVDQWFNACSAQGTNVYPYGDVYDPGPCVDATTTPLPRTSTPNCVGGFPGLLNMSGNVAEWIDACSGVGPARVCHARGGSYLDATAELLACDAGRSEPYLGTPDDVGFRCCLP